MVVAGLWHGAAFGFLVWGFLHGLLLVLDKKFRVGVPSSKVLVFVTVSLGWAVTQFGVFFAWIFFRNPNLNEAFSLINSLLNRNVGIFEISDALLVLTALVLSFSLDLAEIYLGPRLKKGPSIIKGLVLGTFLVVIFTMKSSSVIPFIYFRF
jgi:D-alanyl-lipoteichoic acid acyltransferase DltB (MBOAT superfamily)